MKKEHIVYAVDIGTLLDAIGVELAEKGYSVSKARNSLGFNSWSFNVDGISIRYKQGNSRKGDRIYIGQRFGSEKVYIIPKWSWYNDKRQVRIDLHKLEDAIARKKDIIKELRKSQEVQKAARERDNEKFKKERALIESFEETHEGLILKLREKCVYRGMRVTSIEDETLLLQINMEITPSVENIKVVLKILEDQEQPTK